MAKDLSTTVANYVQSASAAQGKYVTGIQNTSVDPTQLAIRAQGALLANFQQAVLSGRWASKLQAAGKAKWLAQSVAKANNYGVGVTAGEGAYGTAMQTWLPRINAAAAAVKAMPSGSISASNARSAAFATALYNAKRGL